MKLSLQFIAQYLWISICSHLWCHRNSLECPEPALWPSPQHGSLQHSFNGLVCKHRPFDMMTWHDHGILFDSSWISEKEKEKRKRKQNNTTREHNQSLRRDIPWVNNMKPHQWYFPWIENEILWVTSHPLTFWWDRLEEPQGTDTSLVLKWPPGLSDWGASCCSTLFSPFSTNFRTPGRPGFATSSCKARLCFLTLRWRQPISLYSFDERNWREGFWVLGARSK